MDPRHHHQPPAPHHAPNHHEPSPPPPVVHVSHQTPHHQPSPPPPVVQVSHHTPHHQPSPPPPVVHTTHHQPSPPVVHNTHHTPKYTDNKPTIRFYCKAKPDYSLTIRNGKVILAPNNPSDHHQHWIKEEKFSTRVKDKEGFPSFALVNKATGQAMKHSIGATHPVQLTEYNPDKVDESVLWTQSKDLGDGYHAVRMVNNIQLNVDALNGDPEHGGVHDGTTVVLWEWKKGPNQRWIAAPF